jgi:hypothetical protein
MPYMDSIETAKKRDLDKMAIGDLLIEYDEGDLTTKELLGLVFSHLNSHRDDIDAVLATLHGHPDESIQGLGGKLLTLLGVAHPMQGRAERFG